MNMRRDRNKPRELTPQVKANVTRIDAIWSESRKRFGAGGPFLSAHSRMPTRCMPRWCRALRATQFR